MENAVKRHQGYFDAFRGIAIAGVVFTHMTWISGSVPEWLSNISHFGSKGVQLFFIVSGFTIGYNYEPETFNLKKFYWKRFFRISPMYYFMSIFYFALAFTPVFSSNQHLYTLFNWVVTFTYTNGWFPSAINSVGPGGWTIAAEMMFYLCFPFMLRFKRQPAVLVACTAASYVLSVILNRLITKVMGGSVGAESFAYFFWVVQFPAFSTGVTIAALMPYLERFQRLGVKLFFASLLLLCAAGFTRGLTSSYIAADILFAGLVVGGALKSNVVVESKLLQYLGTVSFSVYLIHFLFIRLFEMIFPDISIHVNHIIIVFLAFIAIIIFSTATSTITYKLVELNGKRFGDFIFRRLMKSQ